jgi:phosphohistidine phosphatase
MKRLAIIRHAKTEQENYDSDFTRELLPIGIEDAKNIVADLKKWNIYPDAIISSPANRAIATARIFAEGLGFPLEEMEEERNLYFEMTTGEFVDMIKASSDDVETLFVFGHNPFMHFVAQRMSFNYDGHMPTCSTVILDFDVDSWKEVEAHKGLLFLHLYPKLYK